MENSKSLGCCPLFVGVLAEGVPINGFLLGVRLLEGVACFLISGDKTPFKLT